MILFLIAETANRHLDHYAQAVQLLSNSILKPQNKHLSWERLAYLVDTFGPRMWGSKQLELAIQELRGMAVRDGFDNVYLQPVTNFTSWVRHEQQLVMVSPRENSKLGVSALGYSVSGDITADVLVVNSFEELQNKSDQAKGKIVLFNFNWTNYDDAVDFRVSGPAQVSAKGGVGCLVRSITPQSIYSVHTGYTQYDQQNKAIPGAAITVQDAQMMQRMQDRGQTITVHLRINTSFVYNCSSNNLVFQIRGTQMPEKIILMGGHIDSWDTGSQTGANDDGGGVTTVYDALRLLLINQLRPKRTLRFIAWSGEQSGQSNTGAQQYVDLHQGQLKDHVLAFQSDLGSTRLYGFGVRGGAFNTVSQIAKQYLSSLNVTEVNQDGQAIDTYPLFERGVPQMRNLIEDSANQEFYFKYHHSGGDSMTMMDEEEMDSNVVGIAAMMYILADWPNEYQ